MKFKFIQLSDPYYRDERMLRWEVTQKPKGFPPGAEEVSDEKGSFHLIAIDNKKLVGCIVCKVSSEMQGEISQLAFSQEYKGKPFGRQMLLALEEFLSKKGIGYVYVITLAENQGFYDHLGFIPEGSRFDEYGYCYQKMGKELAAG